MVNGYATPQHRPTTDANANPIRTKATNEEGAIGIGAKAKIVIEDPVKQDVICTVRSTPPQPFGSSSRTQRKEVEEQRKIEQQSEHRSQTSEPKSLKTGKDGQEMQTASGHQTQSSQQPSRDPKMNLQLAMLDNQLRNILKTSREESQGSSSASDRAKCRDTAAAADIAHTALSPIGAGQHGLSCLPLMNGTLDGAVLANLIHDDGDAEGGASRDNRDLNLALNTGATNNDELKLFHPAQPNEEYQAEKEVSVQKPEQLIRIHDDSPRKDVGLVHQISMPEVEEGQGDIEDDGKKVALTGVAVEFTPRHNSIMFGGIDERSQTYLPGGEYAQCTSVYVDENATRMAPYTMATQFNVSMASSEEESEGEGDGKWESGRPFAVSSATGEKHRQRSIYNLQQMVLDTDDKSSSSRGNRRHSVPKSVQLKDEDSARPEQTGHVMSRSADAYTMNINSDSGYLTKDTHSREHIFKSSSSHSSLKDHQNALDIPVGNVSPYKSSKLRKEAGDNISPNKRDKRSSPKKDKFAYIKLEEKDCDSEKFSDKSTSDKDGDHLIIDELENEKTHVATTPCVEVTGLREFEVNSLPDKVNSVKYKPETDDVSRKASMPDTEKFLRDPILEKIKSLSSGTYLPKSFSETSLKSSHLSGSSTSEVPLSDSTHMEPKFKSLCDIRTFKKDTHGNYSCGSVMFAARSQPNLAKVDTKVVDAHLNNIDANDSQSTSTERPSKSKSDLQAKEVQSLPVLSDQQIEERGAADGESPRQVISEGNVPASNPKNTISGAMHKDTPASAYTQTDLRKTFAEKVSLKLTSIKQAEKTAGIVQELDQSSISKEKGKVEWDSSSHSLTDSGRVESGRDPEDCEIQSLNLSKSRSHEPSSRDGHSGRMDMALLNEVDEDSLDPSLPQPRPPAAPAPRKGSKVMAAR